MPPVRGTLANYISPDYKTFTSYQRGVRVEAPRKNSFPLFILGFAAQQQTQGRLSQQDHRLSNEMRHMQ